MGWESRAKSTRFVSVPNPHQDAVNQRLTVKNAIKQLKEARSLSESAEVLELFGESIEVLERLQSVLLPPAPDVAPGEAHPMDVAGPIMRERHRQASQRHFPPPKPPTRKRPAGNG